MEPTAPEPTKKHTVAVWLASGLGVGLVMPAPGTFGALWGLPLAWAYDRLPGELWWWVASLAAVAIGIPICGRAAADLGMKDPGPVVWDEFATVPLVFLFVPVALPWTAVLGFALHRVFDITKPWPCKRLEALPGGLGIVADDVAAALYAAASLWLLSLLWR